MREKKRGEIQEAAYSGSLYSIAIQHERQQKYDAARRMFQLLLNSYESDAAIGGAEAEAPDGRVILAWGKMEARLNNDWAMRKAFASGLRLLPNNTHIPHAWAIEEQKMGNVDSARKLFRYALECDPSDGLVYQSYALLEQQHGRLEVFIYMYIVYIIYTYVHDKIQTIFDFVFILLLYYG